MAAVTSLERATRAAGAAREGRRMLADWETRLELTPAALATREPILALRAAPRTTRSTPRTARTWLAQAGSAGPAAIHGAAQLALLEARAALEGVAAINPLARDGGGRPSPGMALAVEQAKLLWASGKQHRAVVEIQEALNDPALANADPKTASSAQLRLREVERGDGRKAEEELQDVYKSVLADQKYSEKANFHAAKWMDDLWKDATRREQQARRRAGRRRFKSSDATTTWMKNPSITSRTSSTFYATSLRYGHRHVYESLPRLLTVWFDVGASAAAHEAKDRRQQLTVEQQTRAKRLRPR